MMIGLELFNKKELDMPDHHYTHFDASERLLTTGLVGTVQSEDVRRGSTT